MSGQHTHRLAGVAVGKASLGGAGRLGGASEQLGSGFQPLQAPVAVRRGVCVDVARIAAQATPATGRRRAARP